MESGGSYGKRLLRAGGILSIVGGSFEAVAGGILLGLIVVTVIQRAVSTPSEWGDGIMTPMVIPSWAFVVAAGLLVLGVVAIVGGMSALRRKSFGLCLAGAICGLPSGILGILAVIFVSLSKRQFEAQR